MLIWSMGRTIPSFRIASAMEEKEWKPFRNSLDKSDRKIFDRMFSYTHLYNSAASYTARPIRLHPMYLSMIFHHYKQLLNLSKEIKKIWNIFDMGLNKGVDIYPRWFQEALHPMFMTTVLKYSSFCELITYYLVVIKTLNFCRFCLFWYLFGLCNKRRGESYQLWLQQK